MMKHKLAWFTILFATLPILWPFLQKGYFPTQDGGWAVVRLAEMHREIKELQIPPRWAGYLNHGYGYPLFLFTYPFPYYIGEVFHLLGFGLIDSLKLVFILSIVGSGVTMFLVTESHWGTLGGVVSSIVYLYTPYRLVNLYIRGSIGESLAFIFFPLLLWIIQKIIHERKTPYMITGAIVLAAFMLTHNALAVLFLPVLCIWILYELWEVNWSFTSLVSISVTLVIGLLLSAHFWLPAIVEKKYIMLSLIPLANKSEHFVNFKDIFSREWQFGSRPPLQLGWVQLFGALITAIGFFKIKTDKSNKINKLLMGTLGLLTVSFLLLLFPVSQPIWQLPFLKEIDFPWRVLAILAFFLSFIAGGIVKIRKSFLVAVLVIGAVVFLNFSYIKTQPRENKNDAYYETNDATTTSADELMPTWVKIKPTNRKTGVPVEIVNQWESKQRVYVPKNILMTSTKIELSTQLRQNETVIVDQIYFPGWKAWLDNHEITVSPVSNTGLISTVLPRDGNNLKFTFSRTPVRMFADILSLFGLISLMPLWIFSKKLRRLR